MAVPVANSNALEAFIRRLRLHSSLGEEDANAIRSLPVIVAKQRRGSLLVREGEQTAQCAVVVKGYVHRFRTTDSGRRQILGIYIPGDPIDFEHLFLPVADDEAQALDDSVLAYIRQPDLRELFARRPAIAEAVTRALLVDSSVFREWTVNVGQRDARARIAHLLCELSARLTAQGIDVENLPLPLTQDQIADATGLTAIHVNRTLKALSAEQCIERRGALVMLPHANDLQKVAGFDDGYLHIRA
jgi:CRP-like cAMP-binding protein